MERDNSTGKRLAEVWRLIEEFPSNCTKLKENHSKISMQFALSMSHSFWVLLNYFEILMSHWNVLYSIGSLLSKYDSKWFLLKVLSKPAIYSILRAEHEDFYLHRMYLTWLTSGPTSQQYHCLVCHLLFQCYFPWKPFTQLPRSNDRRTFLEMWSTRLIIR